MRTFSTLIGAALAMVCALATRSATADETLTFDGTLEKGGLDHVFIPFDVPAGVREIQIDHDDLSDDDILDWGLDDPKGFRGWGGGNTEPAVVGERAASRSYLTGPIRAGTWRVVIGKAKLVGGSADYQVTVTLRDAPTLAPQKERTPYEEASPLSTDARWYAGDFHVHSIESGDARPPLDEIAVFARAQGLDFVELSDHNTVSQLDFIGAAQKAHPEFLFVPGVEYTTYAGHANGIGATRWVDHKIGQPGIDIAFAADAFARQGALFSINHPMLDLGDLCIGCAWKHRLPADAIAAVEIATSSGSDLFATTVLAFWDGLCDTGRHVAAVGGSDDHSAGQDEGAFSAPIGTPATYVFAEELTVPSLLAGIKAGRTVVKFHGTSDPMVEIKSEALRDGDTIRTQKTRLRAKVTGAKGFVAQWVKNGKALDAEEIDADPFELAVDVAAPGEGQDRYRVEVLRQGLRATVTSHVWVELAKGPSDASGGKPETAAGCSCSARGASAEPDEGGLAALAMMALAFVLARSSTRIH